MSVFARLVREPLAHFLLIGAAVFGLYALTGSERPAPRDRIVITEGRVQQLRQVFARTRQRPPTPRELQGLIDTFVKEEVYYREALKLGLDRDDTLVRRRMQQKMEFLIEPDEAALAATDTDLQTFLEANRAEFRVPPKLAFQQVFINPAKGEAPAAARIAKLLARLNAAPAQTDVSGSGDPTLLPRDMPLSSLGEISRNFGEEFARALTRLPKSEWAGPVRSPFGLHLVRVTRHRDGYDPPLADIRKAVERKWRARKRDEYLQAEYERLRAKYEVVLPGGDTGAALARDGER